MIENTAGVLLGAVPKPVREISCEDSLYLIQILFNMSHNDRPLNHGIGDRLGNLGFATTRNSAGFVANQAFGHGADQTPGTVARRFLQMNLVSGRTDIGLALQKFDALRTSLVRPADGLGMQVKVNVFRDINDIRVTLVHSVTFRLQVHDFAETLNHVFK